MKECARFCLAERIKWWRDWTLLIAVLVPGIQVGLLAMILGLSDDRAAWLGAGFTSWYKVNYIAWNLVFMPISAAMISAMSWELESKSRSWNHLLVMPSFRSMHVLAKAASHLALGLIAQLVLVGLLVLGGLGLKLHDPSLPMSSFEIPLLLHLVGYSFMASLPVIGLHVWLPSRFPSLGGNLGVALLGSWSTFQLKGMFGFIGLLPWSLACQVTDLLLRAKLPTGWMYLSGVLFAVAAIGLGGMDFARRDDLCDR